MANFIDISMLMMVLFVIGGCFANGNEEIYGETSSEEEIEVPGSERFPRHDQSHADSVPFVNDNPGNVFMTQQVFKEGNYDVGYRRGNERHMKEYREIANPKTGHFKIMARWGDKDGGYGEQYWDYNHGGPDEYEGQHEDPNGESSLSVRSPSINSSPSTYNSVSQPAVTPDRVTPPAKTYSEPRIPKKNKKRYEEPPRRRTPKIPEPSSTDENYFVLPRQVNAMSDEQTSLHPTNSDSGPLRFRLHEQMNMLPTTYEHVLQITPSTPRSRGRTIRP